MSASVFGSVRSGSALAAPSHRDQDRVFFAVVVVALVATVLAGFIPTSLARLAAAQAGQRPPPGLVLHAHAITMATWLGLLLVQALLAATGRIAVHRSIGNVAFVLVPAVVIAMTLQMRAAWLELAALPPGVLAPEVLATQKAFLANLLPEQLRAIALFALFAGWALATRRTDLDMHKRMMILATFMPLGAAIDRIASRWFPTTFPIEYGWEHGYYLLWLAPLVIYDWVRRGRPHRAYVIALGLVLPLMVVTQLLWNSPSWQALAPRLLMVDGW